MKKILTTLLLLVLVFTSLITIAACVDDLDEFLGEDTITISFYHTMGADLEKVLVDNIAKFNEIYPNIIVEQTKIGGYEDVRDQCSQELRVGKGPTLAYCYPDHVANYIVGDYVVDLNTFIDSDESVEAGKYGNEEAMPIGLTQAQKDDFIKGYYDEGMALDGERMLFLPFSKSTELLYYNKNFFEAHKDVIEVPTHWWCTESCPANCHSSMEYVCAEIKKIDTNVNTYPLGYDSEANWFITMCEQLGSAYTTYDTATYGSHYLFNNETNRSFVEKFREWHKNGWVTTQSIYGAYCSGLFKETSAEKGKSYMSIGSSAGAANQRPEYTNTGYAFDVGITTIPQIDPTNPKVISQGPSICLFNNGTAEEIEAGWLLMKYLTTSADFQAEFSSVSGYVPVIKSVRDESLGTWEDGIPTNQIAVYCDNLKKANGGTYIAFLAAKQCLDQANAYYTSPAFAGSAYARDMVGALMVECFTNLPGKASVQTEIATVFANAVKTCEDKTPTTSKK